MVLSANFVEDNVPHIAERQDIPIRCDSLLKTTQTPVIGQWRLPQMKTEQRV